MAIQIEQAISLAEARARELEGEVFPLEQAVGRILTETVRSGMMQPPFDRSPLDGYAFRAQDSHGASPEHPVVLRITDKLFAGQESRIPVESGCAVRLMTGSMIPKGADCVLRQEDTDGGETEVRIFREMKSGSNICFRGEEYGARAVLLRAGEKVDAAAAAVAAGAGLTSLKVRRSLRAAILSTGDEVCPPGEPLPRGKIYDSNSIYLRARLQQLGVEVTACRRICDDADAIAAAIAESAEKADLILTTGGVSVGQKDLVEAAAQLFGAEIIFHGIAMKPGMPTLFAARGNTLLLGLSGNPFSAAVPFELLIRALLSRMTGDPQYQLKRLKAVTANGFSKPSPSRRFLRGIYRDGSVILPEKQANGQMRSMIGCNCLADIPGGSGPVLPGTTVDIFLI